MKKILIGLLASVFLLTVHAERSMQLPVFIAPADTNQIIQFRIWLKLSNINELNDFLKNLYDPHSTLYHQFLTPAQFKARYAPTDANVDLVKNYLNQQGFHSLSVANNNFFVRVTANVGQVERIFHVQINNYRYANKIYFFNNVAPVIDARLADSVDHISGLTNSPHFFPTFQQRSTTGGLGSFDRICGLTTTQTANLVDDNHELLIPNMQFRGFIPCHGYSAIKLQHAYGVDQLINQNIDGSGQQIVITDAFGSPTILEDTNAFSTANDLPLLQEGVNFFIEYPEGMPTETDPGWATETTLDVQAAHGFAPKATIILVISPNSSGDLDSVFVDAVNAHPNTVISNSWGHFEPRGHDSEEIITALMQAAGTGISANFSSGDRGDYIQELGHKAVEFPASSTWSTSVGGTSLFFDDHDDYLFETGWGRYTNRTYSCAQSAMNICQDYFFDFSGNTFVSGSTGGISADYPAQPWQQHAISQAFAGGYGIVGTFLYNPTTIYRAVPDVSLFADPYPGMQIYKTPEGGTEPVIEDVGGTSLSCPLFSGLIVLVNQERATLGKPSLGLASAALYNLPSGAVRDITNPHGIGNPIPGLANPNGFQLYEVNKNSGELMGVIFNQDGILTLETGWDDITGVGTPYAPVFVPAVANF